MFSEKRENWVLRDNLKHFCFWFWIWITGHVLYPVRIVEMERGTSSKGGCCELLLAYAARSCSSRLEFEILCKLLNYKGLWPSREPRRLRSRFIVIPLFTRQTAYICTCHENVLSPIKTYPITALKWILGSLSRAWFVFEIPFCQIRLRFISCHFHVKVLHLITYSNHIAQLHGKNSHVTKCFW